jgi:hypothetical protein
MWDVLIGTVVTHFADSFNQTQISFLRYVAALIVIRNVGIRYPVSISPRPRRKRTPEFASTKLLVNFFLKFMESVRLRFHIVSRGL